MKFLLIFLAILSSLSVAKADQKATLTCTGENVVLLEKAPYFGEDSSYSQSLYVLKSTDNDSESKFTAFFLNVFEEGATGTTILTGTNEVGGYFQLEYKRMADVGNGTTIKLEADGVITYNQGEALNGKDVLVKCTIE